MYRIYHKYLKYLNIIYFNLKIFFVRLCTTHTIQYTYYYLDAILTLTQYYFCTLSTVPKYFWPKTEIDSIIFRTETDGG
jgi:hypothetical protein